MDSPDPSHAALHDLDAATDTSLSEVDADNLSDSDWLDISSRESEDAGSTGLPESDLDEGYGRPLSRRSFSSVSSSRDHEVEAWEGLVDSTDDEGLPSDVPELTEDAIGRLYVHNPIGHGYSEQHRVEEALDQSLVSTLSGSRASSLSPSGSVHATRTRDLRLSFPDPLTSSRDELPASFISVKPLKREPLPFTDDDLENDFPALLPHEDPGRASTPAVLRPGQPDIDFEITVYGSASRDPWTIPEALLERLALAAGFTLSHRHAQSEWASTYWLNVKGGTQNTHRVTVIHRVESYQQPRFKGLFAKPSLAIICLPSPLRSLPIHHTRYLPVLCGPPLDFDSQGIAERDAKRKWASLDVPVNKWMLRDLRPSVNAIIREHDLDALEPSDVALAFQPLISQRRSVFKAIKARISATPAMSILAILSLVIGYIVSRTFPTAVPTPSHGVHVLQEPYQLANNSAPSISSTSLSLSSANEVSVAVIVQTPSSLSTIASKPHLLLGRTPVARPVVKGSQTPAQEPHKKAEAGEPRSLMAIGQFPTSLSLAARSKALALLRQSTVDTTSITTTSVPEASKSIYSLSTRLASSLSEMFNVKVLAGALHADMKELLEALDELVRVLGVQASNALSLTKAGSENLREQLRRRHRQAQDRARTIRARGEKALTTLGKQAQASVDQARSRARAARKALTERVGKEVDGARRKGKEWEKTVGQRVREKRSAQGSNLKHGVNKARSRARRGMSKAKQGMGKAKHRMGL
ncbi:hypothetical protein FA95DRAFT_1556437 [Auriscalpium vulgare]|uniref:Uncharacterized protein n=1 Tax=Auriscalpium vulgare TaxID=40419 RepID=A0ACB8S1Q8_9AGAM|nr:hypothetical protein FA95DRAFT_1556437 [Auriscalpium vulgare]